MKSPITNLLHMKAVVHRELFALTLLKKWSHLFTLIITALLIPAALTLCWPSSTNALLIDNGNFTITDTDTGLMWTQQTFGPEECRHRIIIQASWVAGLVNIECLNRNSYLGYKNWRYPTIEELKTRVTGTPQGDILYWSSEKRSLDEPWAVDLGTGLAESWPGSTYCYVWPVRTQCNGACPYLEIFKTGTGTGLVSSTPGGILCGDDCIEVYSSSSLITLNATPGPGSTFINWSGACSGNSSCTIRVNAVKNVTARFDDVTAPVGAVLINDGDLETNTPCVTLTLSASDAYVVDLMMVSNDSAFTDSLPENYSTTKSWILDSEDGLKTVYVKFKDKNDNWSEAYSTSILLDTITGLQEAILSLQISAGLKPSFIEDKPADINGDGKIGREEAIYALQCDSRLRNNRSPILNSIGNKNINEGASLIFSVSATDADNDIISYAAMPLPEGATFNINTGLFSWTPTYSQAGSYQITFNVYDNYGGSASETITITVNDTIPVIGVTDYFPLEVGNWWEYDVGGATSCNTISGTKVIDGYNAMIMTNATGNESYYSSNQDGIKLFGQYIKSTETEVLFDAPLMLIQNNALLGTTQVSTSQFTFVYSGYTYHENITSTTTILGLEDVQTANKTLKDCVKVSRKLDEYIVETQQSFPGEIVYYWFYKGVGSVKIVEGSDTQIIKKSFVNGVEQSY